MTDFMGDIGKIVSINLRRRAANPRFYLALLLTLCTVLIYFGQLTNYLSQYEVKIQAVELFIFAISSLGPQWMLTFCFLLLVGDAPFLHEGIEILMSRTDKKRWLRAQIIAMVCTIVFWLLFFELCILFITAGYVIYRNEWSDYVSLVAKLAVDAGKLGWNVNASVLPLTQGKPFTLFAIAFLYMVLLFVYFAMIGIVINLLSGRSYGSCIVVVFLALRFALFNLLYVPELILVSPANLIDLTVQNIEPPMFIYTVLFFVAQIMILIWAAEQILKRRDICKLR